jgi:tetratricopeptide (TPR) repeat protein
MRVRYAPLAALNLFLGAALAAVGFSGLVASAIRLPSEVVISGLEQGQPTEQASVDAAAGRLERAAAFSNRARSDLALAMLAQGVSVGDRIAGDHAARQLRLYLAGAPDDAVAWANLALAELRAGTTGAAVTAYKMSIELAPASVADLIPRCAFGIDIYALLDDEGKETLARQVQTTMNPALGWDVSHDFIAMVRDKKAVVLVKALMAGDPDAAQRFDSLIAQP